MNKSELLDVLDLPSLWFQQHRNLLPIIVGYSLFGKCIAMSLRIFNRNSRYYYFS